MTPLSIALTAWMVAILGTTLGVILLLFSATQWFPAKVVTS
jgi:hypothetical protein